MDAPLTAAAAITCPAGTAIQETAKGPGCYCALLRETITRDDNSSTLVAYCAGRQTEVTGYGACSAWRAMRDAEIEHEDHLLQSDIDRSGNEARVA